jgi:hypothetical protein
MSDPTVPEKDAPRFASQFEVDEFHGPDIDHHSAFECYVEVDMKYQPGLDY